MGSQIVTLVIRGLLQSIFGWLVLKGFISSDTAMQLLDSTTAQIVGVVGIVGTLVWSYINKKKLVASDTTSS
jgi:hypothetical protein